MVYGRGSTGARCAVERRYLVPSPFHSLIISLLYFNVFFSRFRFSHEIFHTKIFASPVNVELFPDFTSDGAKAEMRREKSHLLVYIGKIDIEIAS